MKLFNKLRQQRLKNKIDKLNLDIDTLYGIPEGYYKAPDWDKGGSDIVDKTKKIFKLQDKLNKLKKKHDGGAVGPNNIL